MRIDSGRFKYTENWRFLRALDPLQRKLEKRFSMLIGRVVEGSDCAS